MCYGPEFAARAVRHWLGRLGVKTLFIEPGSPWENGYCENFNSKLRDELLNAELFSTLYEAEVLIESWRRHYNAVRPHSSLGYRPPAPEAILPPDPNSRVGIAVGGRPNFATLTGSLAFPAPPPPPRYCLQAINSPYMV